MHLFRSSKRQQRCETACAPLDFVFDKLVFQVDSTAFCPFSPWHGKCILGRPRYGHMCREWHGCVLHTVSLLEVRNIRFLIHARLKL
jgi:hypothetical protein